jgi:hypothetical protein
MGAEARQDSLPTRFPILDIEALPYRPMPRCRMLAIVNGLLAAVVAVSAPVSAAPPEQRPYSCRLLDDEVRKCAFGACDARTLDRLRKECLRDGGRP